MKERNLIQLLSIGPLFFIPIMVALISFVVIDSEKGDLTDNLTRLEGERTETIKSTIRAQVNGIVDLAAYRKSITKKELHDRIQQRVEDAYQIAVKLRSRYAGSKSEQEVKQLIIEALRPLVWNDGESFIWILDLDGVFFLAPEYLQHLEGQSVIGFKDAMGREIIKEEIELTQTKGQGFLWDTLTKPSEDSTLRYEQLAFVKKMGFYNWYLGSSEYLQTATQKTDTRLLAAIDKIGNHGSDYFFIMNREGTLLLNHSIPEMVGHNVNEVENTPLKAVFDKIMQAINLQKTGVESHFIDYEWLNPAVNAYELKKAFVQTVPGTDWIVGSGFFPADVSRQLRSKKAEMVVLHEMRLDKLWMKAGWSFLFSIAIALLLSMAIYKLLYRYRQKVTDKNAELRQFNLELEDKIQERTSDLESANEALQILAITDSLTGIHNRYSIMQRLEAEIKRAKRFNEPFSLIMFDIDFFKLVNDEYGHDVGDVVLIELVSVLKHHLREVDLFCRFGGEEFVILLPNTLIKDAGEMAERLRLTVVDHAFASAGTITISLGVAEYQVNKEIDELLKSVDMALYKAKHAGRNCVRFAEDSMELDL
jgi:diguanylate cyclase (GGDEF)-like protein